MLAKFKSLYRRSVFDDSILGFILNPSFIARSSLFRHIKFQALHFKGVDVLDVGCGSKPYYNLFKATKTYTGVDTNLSGHDHHGESIDVFYDGKLLPFKSMEFGGAICFQVLEHVEDPSLLLMEINRVLTNGASLLITVPFCWPEHEQPYDFRRFTSYGMSKMLKDSGFDVVDMFKTTTELQTIIQLFITSLAMKCKTPWGSINVGINLMFVGPLNLIALISGYLFKSKDLYCDLVVLAKKNEL